MKRVAIFIPGAIGHVGTEMYVPAHVNLIGRLSEKFDVTVYSHIKPDGDDTPFLCGNAKVKFIRAHYDDHIIKKIFLYIKDFQKDHRKQPYSLVHGFWGFPCGFASVLVGKTFRVPSLVSLQGGEAAALPVISYGDMLKQPLRFLTLWTCENAEALTALTEFQRDAMRRFGLRRDGICVIPYGVDTKLFVHPDKRTPSPPVHFIHVANLNRVKDQISLLRAFKLISEEIDCCLRIVGPDHMKGSVQRYACELKISDKVDFLGYVSHEEMPNQYSWSHVMLHTSLYEGQGVVIGEAAASGVVISGTRVGLISDFGEERAIGVDVGDYRTLAKRVIDLLEEPQRFAALQKNALEWCVTHDSEWTATQFEDIYHRLIRN